MKNFWDDVLSFSNREKRGIIALIGLVGILSMLNLFLPYIYRDHVIPEITELNILYDTCDTYEEVAGSEAAYSESGYNLKNFDPNYVTAEDLVKMGIPSSVAKTVINYRDKGGRFSSPKDFSKVYGLSKDDFERLYPFIIINEFESTKENKPKISRRKNNEEHYFVSLNRSDSADWVKLKGIGPVLSSRIIKFRNSLGGFSEIRQISEVYGLRDSVFQRIRSFIIYDTIEISKLALAKASFKELLSHPYISYEDASAISNYLKKHKRIDSLEQFYHEGIIDTKKLRKLEPYISID